MMLILLFAVSVLLIGLMVATPVWRTQIQREKEEELLFRGNQYVEAIRIFQKKNPGAFPQNLKQLLEEKCIRRLYKDPMTKTGEWNVVLLYPEVSSHGNSSSQKVMIASQNDLDSIDNPQIIGVVSKAYKESKKVVRGQNTYDRWLFYYGQSHDAVPEIVYFNQRKK